MGKKLLEEAANVDAEEDSLNGTGKRRDELPPDLAIFHRGRAKIREARKALEAEAKWRAPQAAKEKVEAGGKPRNDAEK